MLALTRGFGADETALTAQTPTPLPLPGQAELVLNVDPVTAASVEMYRSGEPLAVVSVRDAPQSQVVLTKPAWTSKHPGLLAGIVGALGIAVGVGVGRWTKR